MHTSQKPIFITHHRQHQNKSERHVLFNQSAIETHMQKERIKLYQYLFDAREIEVKAVIDPTQNLVSSNEVSTVHHSNVRRHLKRNKSSLLCSIGRTQMQCDDGCTDRKGKS